MALDAWAAAVGNDSKFWETSEVFLMIAILRKIVDDKEVLAFRLVPTAARQFDFPTANQYCNGNPLSLLSCFCSSRSDF